MTGKERKRNLQLTRYIVCALMLGNGLLFAPTAEADDIEVTGAPNSTLSIYVDKTNHWARPQYNTDTWTLNYNSSDNAWALYSAYGAYKGTGGGQFTLQNGTITNAYGKHVSSGSVSGGIVNINGGEVTGFVYGGYSENSTASENIVTIEGSPTLSSAVIVGGKADSVASGNIININSGVTVAGIKGGEGSTSTGNTLNLGATGIKVGDDGIRETQTIAITSGVGFDTSKTVLEMTGNFHNVSDIKGVTYLDLTDATGLTNTGKTGYATTVGTMTLVEDTHQAIGISKWKYGTNKEGNLTDGTAFATNTGQTYTGGNGAKLIYTNTHTVKFRNTNKYQIDYTIANSVTGVNLASWDSSKAAFAVPTGWTNSSSAIFVTGTFAATPSLAAGTSKDIVTAGANFFSNVSIDNAIKYKDVDDFTNDTANGVTLSGDIYRGVKVTDNGTNANAKLTYFADTKKPTSIVLGDMTWGTGRAMSTGYDFSGVTSINTTGLKFSNPTAVTGSMTLLSNATGLTAGDNINHSQDFSTDAANGATLNATLNGSVTRTANTLGYTATGTTLNSINLNGWTGTAGTLPTGWTKPTTGGVAVETGNFSVTPTTNFDIFTTTTENFFGNVTGDRAYTAAGEAFSNEDKGVTISGNKAGGVKVTNNGTIANAKLTYYAEAFDGQNITLDSMAWGTPRDAGSAYNFSNLTAIDATNLSFTNPMAVGSNTALLTNATDLPANFSPITYASGASSHTQNFTNAAADNGAKFNGTINGTVSTTLGQVNYTVSDKSITGIDLAGWDSTKNAYSLTGWANGLTASSINAAGFTAPTTLTAGSSKAIITTSTENYFSNDYITGAQKYGPSGAPSSDTDAGVTFTGSQEKGVKASDNGQNLVYAVGDMTVSDITLGNMAVGNTGVVTPRTADANYTFNGSTTIDATNLKFDKPADVADSTLVTSATGITDSNPVTGASHSQAITNEAMGTGGITVSGTLNGTVSADTGEVKYTVNDKTISSMDLSGWDTTTENTGLPNNKWTGSNVTVNANNFAADAPTENKTIFTTTTDGFFGNVTGDLAYKSGVAFSGDEVNGVTLSGTRSGGVKKSNDGSDLEYIAEVRAVNNIALGNMTAGTPRTATSNYTFNGSTSIDATNLTFDKPADVADSTLFANATGITTGNSVTGASHSQAITNAAMGGGITASGTLHGTVAADTNAVKYTVADKTVSSIDLSGWDTTATVNGLPNNKWTGSNVAVSTGTFTAPTADKTIFTTDITNFFGDVTGAMAYTSGAAFSGDEGAGVTLSGTKSGGVKKSDDGKNLNFIAEVRTVNNISLGNMAVGNTGVVTPRTADTNYAFDGTTTIDATNLKFDKPADVADSTLFANATGITTGNPVTGASHSQAITNAAMGGGITASGTLHGTVAAATNAVSYTVNDKTISSMDLSGWDGTTTVNGLPNAKWTGSNVAVSTGTFTAPTGNKTIFTTNIEDFFGDVTGAMAYKSGVAFSGDKVNGVTLSGTKSGGVKKSDDGSDLNFIAEARTVNNISLGDMAVGNTGVVTPRTADTNYTFNGSTTIDATNLKFDKPADVADSTLFANAAGITTGNTVTGESHSQAITNAAMGGGITASGTLHGTVAAATNAVSYTVNDKTISSMDLSGWNGTTVSGLPNAKWTGSNVAVSTGTFTAPTANKTIFTTNIGGFFGDVTGAMAYTSDAAFSGDEVNGVTLSGTRSGGVKKSDDGKNLNFIAEARTVNNISLGNMTWGTGRAMPATGYTFSVADNGVDATGLKFSFTGDTVNTIGSSTPVWNLVTGATGLDGGLTVKGSPVSQTVSYGINKVANLTGTLTGDVTTANNTVQYKVTGKTLDKVDISNWDGSTVNTALNTSWSKKDSGIAVTGSGFTAPTAVGDYNILTATPTGYFTGAQIADSIAYKTGGQFSETASNITLSGTQDRGVKVNDTGTALQYSIGKANINNIKVGNVTYTKDGTLIDKSASLYDYSQLNSNGLDISGFGLSMTDEQKKSAAANDSMTLVKANTTLNDIAAKETGKSTYTYDATSGLAVKGALAGAVAATGNNVVYAVKDNKAATLTFGTVAWNTGTYARQASEIAYTGALVNADNITFTSANPLNVGDTMILVSNYGDSVNKIRSGIFTLNGQIGKGHAYWSGNNLYYVIDRAAGTSVPPVDAIGGREIVDGDPDYHNPAGVPGGQAKGDGESKDNETIINNSHIHKNTDGTGGDANGGTSEDGDANKNHLTVKHSEVDGDGNGGKSDTGDTEENEVIIEDKSVIHGDVNGGSTGGPGDSKRNKATVKDSTVDGDANGGKSQDGDTEGNEVTIEGNSVIHGDVNGGNTGGHGDSKHNKTIVKDSTVDGDANGGKSENGDTEGNEVILTGSKIGNDVNGGHSGGNGASKGNEVTVENSTVGGDVNGGHSGGNGDTTGNDVDVKGSKVNGDVNGGKSDGTGNANENKTTVEGGSEIGGNVIGGQSNGGNTNKNETTVSGGSTVTKDVIGGKTNGDGTSSENKTSVDGSNVGGSVIGGQSENGDANKNETNVTGGSTVTGDVLGGKTTGTGNANENNVNIDGGSTVNGNVYGGYSATGDASGNGIDIGTGKINGDIYGGFSGGSGSTINNTITLHGGADVSNSNIIGGNNGSDGNTLNIGNSNEPWIGGSQSVKNISGFETLNYTNLLWNSTSPALTISDGTSSDLSGTTITAKQVAFTGIKTLTVGSTMTLLDQSNVTPASKRATKLASGSAFTVGTATEGAGKLVLDANGNVVYQVESAGASRQTHNTVMAAEAAAVALNAGNDFILSAREGLARKENVGKDGIAVFAKIGGGATRQETGSHVNVNMWNGIVAFGRKNVQKESTTEYGVFVEHGWGNFSTHNDNAQRGDGSVDYTGGGLLGKWTKADGLYVEGSLRIGSMHEKANNLLRDTVRGYGYDERTTYKGFHLGVGKEFAVKDGNTVEVYGKYFYNRKDGMNFNAGLDEYNLDAVTSQILRVGACYTMKRERWNYYGDLSYEHELDGRAAGRANGMAIRGADTSGGSVRLELGAKLLANEKSPWTLDLNLTGYAGKKQGLQGGASVKFMF